MVSELYLIPNEALDRSMKRASLQREEIVRSSVLLLMRTLHLQCATNTCLKNPNQSCVTSSGCSLTRIHFSLTPPVVLEVRCERLRALARSTALGLNLTRSSRT